ncbi:ATP-grasp domain-containing protein [Streptomyces sp. NPDC018019]|uniref:ATP-grasp domain-containing protein n=1 Tax=Streptomyces sp. NPDC018019 TaxID=3365030 RepID=UPI0037ADFFCC
MSHRTRTSGVFVVVESGLGAFGLTPLQAARAQGFHTAFVTGSVSRYVPDSHAREAFAACVDEVVEADTHDSAAVLAALKSTYDEGELRGIYSTTDYSTAVVAETARALGLPGLSPDAAHTARNKLRTRQAAEAAQVPTPAWAWARSESEAVAAAERIGLPCVVKPMTEAGSVGVRLCRTTEEVAAHYHSIASVPTDYRGGRRTPGVLVEEYLVGFEVSVESVTVEGVRTVLGVTDKALGPHPHFVELGETFPSILPDSVQKQCTATAAAALDAVGHDFGAAHVEIKMTATGPKLIEVNARMPGAQITRLIHESTGLHLQREMVRLHTGREPDLTLSPRGAAASRYLTASRDGVVRAVFGADLVHRSPGVVLMDLHVAPGDRIRVAENNVDVLGGVVAVGQDSGEAVRRADAAMGQLGIEVG